MGQIGRTLLVLLLCTGFSGAAMAAEKGAKKGHGKDITAMSQEQQIKIAQSAAPARISKEATIMVFGQDGKLTEAKKGSNGFTCIPTVNFRPVPDPMCFDAAVGQWVDAMVNKKDKPDNTIPGVSYMARGGYHWEKGGKIVMCATFSLVRSWGRRLVRFFCWITQGRPTMPPRCNHAAWENTHIGGSKPSRLSTKAPSNTEIRQVMREPFAQGMYSG